MSRRVHTIWAILTSALIAASGCRPQQPFYLHEDKDLSHYIGVATQIDYPDVCTTSLDEVTQAEAPLTLENLKFASYWDLTLEEAIHITLRNSRVFRSLGGRFVSSAFNNRAQTGEAPDAITLTPDAIRTSYDPSIVETTPFVGVEPALAAFDAQWSTNLFFQKNDRQQNVQPTFPINDFFRQVFQQDLSQFNTQLTKVTAQGGQFAVRNNITYDFNNNPTRQVPEDWNANYELSFQQPLLAGAGAEFNRIAGPFNPFSSIPGGAQQSPSFDGVLIARINVDISLAEFEIGVRNMVSEVESAYWELAFAWRNLDTANIALGSALQTWRKVHALYKEGAKGGEAAQEAQAREQYYQFKSNTQSLLNELFRTENRLRYVMGIAPTDGRLIVPVDKPTVAKVDFEWHECYQEALARSVDLRRQKWRIKQRELELVAAKNLLMPRLDLNGTYRWLGLGDNLFGTNDTPFTPTDPLALTGSSALQTLATGQFQEWALGAQMTMPIGFRKELAQVRHFELQLARARSVLADEELEVGHQLTDALRQLVFNYELTETNFNRTVAADHQVDAVEAAFENQFVTLDQLLEAQRRRAEAQTSFFRTLLDYQRAIIAVHLRKGSLLEYNNVYLTEGPWPAKAQFDAHRLARQRDAGIYLNYGYTRPSVMSQGAVRQLDTGDSMEIAPTSGEPTLAPPREELPVPMPDAFSMGRPTAARAPLSPQASSQATPQVAGQPMEKFEWGSLGLREQQTQTASPTATKIATSGQPVAPATQRPRQPNRIIEPATYQEPARNYTR